MGQVACLFTLLVTCCGICSCFNQLFLCTEVLAKVESDDSWLTVQYNDWSHRVLSLQSGHPHSALLLLCTDCSVITPVNRGWLYFPSFFGLRMWGLFSYSCSPSPSDLFITAIKTYVLFSLRAP